MDFNSYLNLNSYQAPQQNTAGEMLPNGAMMGTTGVQMQQPYMYNPVVSMQSVGTATQPDTNGTGSQAQQSYMYNPTATSVIPNMGYTGYTNYYPNSYYPQNTGNPAQGTNFYMPMQQQTAYYNPMSTPMMNQFAQFMSMMNPGMVQNSAHPVIEGQKFPPPESYTCNKCKQKGHWIQFCPLNKKKNTNAIFEQKEKIECSTCQKWFISEQKKQEHLAKHVHCPYPDCDFSAIDKILQEHIQTKHKHGIERIPAGLLELIPEKYRYAAGIGNNPEEIKKWREARRRNYPTQTNLARKEAAKAEVELAGGLAAHDSKRLKPDSNERLFAQIQGRKIPLCKDYLKNRCSNVNCRFLHDPCKKNKDLCKAFVRGYCAKGVNCRKLHNPNDRMTYLQQRFVEPDAPSLLTQLLDQDELKENSYILQCFKYIANNGMIPIPDSLKEKLDREKAGEKKQKEESSDSSSTSSSESSTSSSDSSSDSEYSSSSSSSESESNEKEEKNSSSEIEKEEEENTKDEE